MHDIKIYGEVVPFQDQLDGWVNLTGIQHQLKEANGQDIRVRINCVGGDVEEGFAIYSELRRYAKENNAKVITLAEGRCASIATVIFLAGDERITTEYTAPFVHNAWTYVEGDAKQLLRLAVDLEVCNKQIAEHYEKHTDLTYEEARALMDAETSITPEECVALRFATSVESVLRPLALKKLMNTKLNIKMTKKEDKKKSGFLAKVRALFSNKIVFDADNVEVDFFELIDEDTISLGDLATIDGNPAEGSILMATGETFVFTAGELTEIVDAEEEEDEEENEDPETMAALQAKVVELEGLLETAAAKYNKAKSSIKDLKSTLGTKEAALANFEALKSKYSAANKKENKKENSKPADKFGAAIDSIVKSKKQ
jgi:ATP-dependent Clp protease protease subunit